MASTAETKGDAAMAKSGGADTKPAKNLLVSVDAVKSMSLLQQYMLFVAPCVVDFLRCTTGSDRIRYEHDIKVRGGLQKYLEARAHSYAKHSRTFSSHASMGQEKVLRILECAALVTLQSMSLFADDSVEQILRIQTNLSRSFVRGHIAVMRYRGVENRAYARTYMDGSADLPAYNLRVYGLRGSEYSRAAVDRARRETFGSYTNPSDTAWVKNLPAEVRKQAGGPEFSRKRARQVPDPLFWNQIDAAEQYLCPQALIRPVGVKKRCVLRQESKKDKNTNDNAVDAADIDSTAVASGAVRAVINNPYGLPGGFSSLYNLARVGVDARSGDLCGGSNEGNFDPQGVFKSGVPSGFSLHAYYTMRREYEGVVGMHRSVNRVLNSRAPAPLARVGPICFPFAYTQILPPRPPPPKPLPRPKPVKVVTVSRVSSTSGSIKQTTSTVTTTNKEIKTNKSSSSSSSNSNKKNNNKNNNSNKNSSSSSSSNNNNNNNDTQKLAVQPHLWTATQVSRFVHFLGFQPHAHFFLDAGVDGKRMFAITPTEMRQILPHASPTDRTHLLNAIRSLTGLTDSGEL